MKVVFFGMALRQFGKKIKGHIPKGVDKVFRIRNKENKSKIVLKIQKDLLLQNT